MKLQYEYGTKLVQYRTLKEHKANLYTYTLLPTPGTLSGN